MSTLSPSGCSGAAVTLGLSRRASGEIDRRCASGCEQAHPCCDRGLAGRDCERGKRRHGPSRRDRRGGRRRHGLRKPAPAPTATIVGRTTGTAATGSRPQILAA
jgi:hypothetical protein